MRRVWAAVAVAAAVVTIGAPAWAAENDVTGGDNGKPLWEVEALGLVADEPDYPGSSQMHLHYLPLPWVVYRGKFLRTDDRGTVEGMLLNSRRFSLDVSARMSFPTESKSDAARIGMPDLGWLGEVGPRAKVGLYYWQNYATGRVAKVQLELPVRAAVSTDLKSLSYRGLVAQPALAYTDSRFLGTHALFKLSAGPIFATSQTMDYFYSVPAQYAMAGRAAYAAKAGYLAADLHSSLEVPIGDRVQAIGAVDYLNMSGAANTASPLMKANSNISVMMLISVSLYKSDARVPAEAGD